MPSLLGAPQASSGVASSDVLNRIYALECSLKNLESQSKSVEKSLEQRVTQLEKARLDSTDEIVKFSTVEMPGDRLTKMEEANSGSADAFVKASEFDTLGQGPTKESDEKCEELAERLMKIEKALFEDTQLTKLAQSQTAISQREKATAAEFAADHQLLQTGKETDASAVLPADVDLNDVDVSVVCGNDDADSEEVNDLRVENITLFELIIFKVASAKSGTFAQTMNACLWVLLALCVAWAEAVCVMSIAIGVAWPRCSSSDDCWSGMACVSLKARGVQSPATCEDCYYLSDQLGAISDDLYAHTIIESDIPGGVGMTTQNATNQCLEQLSMTLFHFEAGQAQDFSKCLYVMSAQGLMSPQDKIVLILTFALVALAMAKEGKQEARARILASACLPIHMPELSTASVGVFLAIIVLKYTLMILRYIVLSLLPPTLILLLVTEGANSTNILLDGLSMCFVLEIDDSIPEILVSQFHMAKAQDFLSDVARKHPPFCKSIVDNTHFFFAYAVLSFIILIRGFADVANFNCEQVIHFLYYRIGISYGLWLSALLQATSAWLRQLSDAFNRWPDLWQQSQHKTSFAKLVDALSVLLRIVSCFLEPLLGAFSMNLFYWYQSNVLFYDSTLEYSFELWFFIFVFDLFGACGRGFADSCL